MEKINETPLMRRDITYIDGVQLEEAVEITRHCFFRDDEMELVEREIHNPEEFKKAYEEWIDRRRHHHACGKSRQHTLQPVSHLLFHKKHARRAKRCSKKRNQYSVKYTPVHMQASFSVSFC